MDRNGLSSSVIILDTVQVVAQVVNFKEGHIIGVIIVEMVEGSIRCIARRITGFARKIVLFVQIVLNVQNTQNQDRENVIVINITTF